MLEDEIKKTQDRFIAALRDGDAAGCAAVYPDDGVIMPANAPRMVGRAAIQEFWQGAIGMGIKDGRLETVTLEEHGDTAVEVGAYTLTIEPAGGTAMEDVGSYIVVWRKQADGSWLWGIDMFSSDLPAPGG